MQQKPRQPDRVTRSTTRRGSRRGSQPEAGPDDAEAPSHNDRARASVPAASSSAGPSTAPTPRSVSGTKRKRSRSRSRSPKSSGSGSSRRAAAGAGTAAAAEGLVPPIPPIPSQYLSPHRGTSPQPRPPPPHRQAPPRQAAAEPYVRSFELAVVQQPTTGCAFMQDALSRIPVAPPLIAQLRTFDKEGVEITAGDDLPYLTCTVSLLTEHGGDANLVMASPVPSASTPEQEPSSSRGKKRVSGRRSAGKNGAARGTESRASSQHAADAEIEGSSSQLAPLPSHSTAGTPTRTLAGDRPAQGELYLDLDDQRRLFFIFPEVCIRLPGRFRLQINLSRIPSSNEEDSPFANSMLTGAVTDVITVVDRESFVVPGPTRLMRRLAEQGVVFTTSGIANDS